MNKLFRMEASVLALVLGAGFWAAAPAALAQTSAAAGPELEEVVVTARRVEENIQSTPVAVTALSGEKLEQLVIKSPVDLMKLAPGLQIGGCSGSTAACVPVVRGQGTAFATGRSSVVPYFAEVAFFQQSYFDLQSLQVVKGPQGTLFGETATGGVLLYTPRKPGTTVTGYALAKGGNYSYGSLEGAVGGPIWGDKVLGRAAFEYDKRKGFTHAHPSYAPGSTIDMDNLDRFQWRLSLVLRPTDSIENYTIWAGSRNKTNGYNSAVGYVDPRFMNPGAANLIPANIPSQAAAYFFETGVAPPPGKTYKQLLLDAYARQLAAGPREYFNNYSRARQENFQGFVNQTRWDITSNVSLRNIFGLYWTKTKGSPLETDGVDVPLTDTAAPFVAGPVTTRSQAPYAWTGGWPTRTLTNETQALGKLFDGRLQWQGGFYYSRVYGEKWTPTQGIVVVFTTPQGDPASAAYCASVGVASPCSQISKSMQESYAVYGQSTYAVTDALHVTGGYRRTFDYRRTDASAAAPFFVNVNGFNQVLPVAGRGPLPGAGVVSTIVPRSHQDTYTLTADYQVNDKLLVYAAHRTGYKAGGINSNATPGSTERVFGPERLKDVEIGAKADWEIAGVRGRTNIALYRDWYKNIQRSQIIPGTATTVTTNLADAILQGVEVDGSVYLTDWFRLDGNLSYLDAKYTRWSESLPCSTQYWRPQCAGLPGTTQVQINHANGTLTVNGAVTNFQPDRPQDAAKWKWSLQPTFLFKPWTGEDISVGANIYYTSSYTGNAANYSTEAGLTPLVEPTIIGTLDMPFFIKSRTLVDLRADWRHVRNSNFSIAASVTNLGNKVYNVANACGFSINGAACTLLGDPRFWYIEGRVDF